MSAVSIVVCDGCGTNGKNEDSNRPEGWITIRMHSCRPCSIRCEHGCEPGLSLVIVKNGIHKSVLTKKEIDFCSLECLQRFFKYQFSPSSS